MTGRLRARLSEALLSTAEWLQYIGLMVDYLPPFGKLGRPLQILANDVLLASVRIAPVDQQTREGMKQWIVDHFDI